MEDTSAEDLQRVLNGKFPSNSEICCDDQIMTTEVLSTEPPVVVLHNFCSAEEAKAIIATAEETLGFKRSEVGIDGKGKQLMRTSQSASVEPTDSAELLVSLSLSFAHSRILIALSLKY